MRHDHINDSVGNCLGIDLGCSANTVFGTYGLSESETDRIHGARVFIADQNDPDRLLHMKVACSQNEKNERDKAT